MIGHKAVVTSNQNKQTKIFTGTRKNFALRGLKRISQINTLFLFKRSDKTQPMCVLVAPVVSNS